MVKKYSQAAARRMARELEQLRGELRKAKSSYLPGVEGVDLCAIVLGAFPEQLSAIKTARKLGFAITVETGLSTVYFKAFKP